MVTVKEAADRAEAVIANMPEKAQFGVQHRPKQDWRQASLHPTCMRAIESTTKDDDTKWLTYWVVFACFSVVDFFADNILRFFPFYWLAKIIFLVYCFAPTNPNGSVHIYNKIIRPVFLRHETSVNKMASEAGAGIRTVLQKAASSATKNE
nr:receptor expression-enhancing protein 6-like isoform X1 [Rhipicephalus microplus]